MVTYSANTAAAIFEAAVQLMLKQGDGGLRVDAVAAAAGCNKRLIYHYFGNRESLVAAVYQQQWLLLRSSKNGLSENTRRFLDQQLRRLWPEFVSSEYPDPDSVTGLPGHEDMPGALSRALLLVVPLLLRGAARINSDVGAAGVSANNWQKVTSELIACVFSAESRDVSVNAYRVSEDSHTPSKPRYRMASASRVVD